MKQIAHFDICQNRELGSIYATNLNLVSLQPRSPQVAITFYPLNLTTKLSDFVISIAVGGKVMHRWTR